MPSRGGTMSSPSEALHQLRWTGHQARWFLIAMHVPYITFLAGMGVTGLGYYPAPDGALALPLVLVLAALQLRHSLAASHGARPRYWQWSLLLLLIVAYAPLPLF